jgi:hypothetical protein
VSTNTCDCPRPPGGRVICSSHQIAVCRIKNGEVEAQCIDMPDTSGMTKAQMRAAALREVWSVVGGEERPALLDFSESRRILRSGRFEHPSKGLVIFKLPRSIRMEAGRSYDEE